MRKNNKGITLIALVVTIIVLLILAGVAIVTLTGDNGIITRTLKTKKLTKDGEITENIKLAFMNAQIGKYARKRDETFTDVIKNELENVYGENSVSNITDNGNDTYTLTLNDKTYDIDTNGNVTKRGASIVVGDVTIVDATGSAITTKIQAGEATVFIRFTASLTGANDLAVTSPGLTPTLTTEGWVTEVGANDTYTFNITGTVDGETSSTIKTVTVNSFSNLPTGFSIGSTVTYTPSGTSTWKAALCSSTKTATQDDVVLQTTATGAVDSGKTNMSITSWRVLHIDKKNDEVELISTAPSPNKIYLGEAQGYNNGVYLLNKACNELYGGTITKSGTQYTITGRNVNIKDIEDRMTNTALNDDSTGAHKWTDGTITYGNQYSSAYTNYKKYPLIYVQESKSVINGNEKTSGIGLSDEGSTPIYRGGRVSEPQQLQGGETAPKTTTKTSNNNGYVTATTSIQPYHTYWSKDNNFMKTAFKAPTELKDTETDGTQNTNYNLFITDGASITAPYWIASRCIYAGPRFATFSLFKVHFGGVTRGDLFDSEGYTFYSENALRPIISLSADLISGDTTSGFKIE